MITKDKRTCYVRFKGDKTSIKHTSISHVYIFKDLAGKGVNEPVLYLQQRRKKRGQAYEKTTEIFYPLSKVDYFSY